MCSKVNCALFPYKTDLIACIQIIFNDFDRSFLYSLSKCF